MATLDICEYTSLAADALGSFVPTGREPAGAFQQVAVGGSSAVSLPFSESTRYVRLHTDVSCRVQFGATPVASASTMRLGAGSTEFFGVVPNQKLAVIAAS